VPGEECLQATEEAVRVLEAMRPSPELAWAYASLGTCDMTLIGRRDEAIGFVEKARDLGERLQQPDVMSYALNAIGLTVSRGGQDGIDTIRRALRIALDAGLQEAAGRAHTSLQESAIFLQRFDDAERYYREGMAYCEGRELGVFSLCLMGWRSHALLQGLDRGHVHLLAPRPGHHARLDLVPEPGGPVLQHQPARRPVQRRLSSPGG
jgi:tetratricopeptide (TPR) repeat protein